MKTSWWVRTSILLFFVFISVLFIIPTAFHFDDTVKYPIKSKVTLGLDLQGGLYMVLGIDFKKVYADEVKTTARKVEQILKERGITATSTTFDDSDKMDPKQTLAITEVAKIEDAKNEIKKYFGDIIRITKVEAGNIEMAISSTFKRQVEEQSVGKSIEVIRNRIDEFGVAEPEIISQGNDRIVVQLPGVRDIERAKELIGRTAKLEFKIVNVNVSMGEVQKWLDKAKASGLEYKKGDRFSNYLRSLNEFLRADLPVGYELAFEKQENALGEEIGRIPYLVEVVPRISGDDLSDARVNIDQQKQQPYVGLDFKPQGAKKFEQVTGENIGKPMAIILDGNVYSAPRIQSKISGGSAQITLGAGNFNKTMKEAKDLALVLRAGALPVQLEFQEQRTVGPNLGNDSIEKAKLASMIGCGLVFLFAIWYYRFSGIIAVATLVLNVLFTIAILIGMEATLTLPGIAGIALTVGMAVDANIIIYERIRDELRKGLSYAKAVEMGFANSLWTILDANITTFAAGLCLLQFGTGPIRGFAVTLLIGIAVTVYTAYFGSKIFFELYMDKTQGKNLSI